jgi:hypothetical protein
MRGKRSNLPRLAREDKRENLLHWEIPHGFSAESNCHLESNPPLRFDAQIGGEPERDMAQIWLSYDEVAALCRCAADVARAKIEHRGWPRRRCSDGLVRVKLPADLAGDFFAYARERALQDATAAGAAPRPALIAAPIS